MATDFSEDLAPWILEVSQARAAAAERRRRSKAEARADRKASRQAGLVARHARKLARSRTPGMLF